MNVLHINNFDQGGAARAMYRLIQGLRRLGHRCQPLVGHWTGHGATIGQVYSKSGHFLTLADKILDYICSRLETRLGIDNWAQRNSWRVPQTSVFQQADVVNLHNLHGGFFNFRALSELTNHKPVVWTLHDMWALTGHCAYSYDCERWRTGCHDCPLLKEPGRQIIEPTPVRIDRTRSVWEAKRHIYRNAPLHIITPSQWLCSLVQESILSSAVSVQCIPHGIDLDVFRPLDLKIARKALDLPTTAHVIFFSAYGTHGRKGFDYFLKALEPLHNANSICLLVSGGNVELGDQVGRFRLRQLGHLSDERLQRLAFTAADLFVFPTLADNQPLVLIEALGCGTPIVSFDVGGVPEMVRHLETGYLARYKDINDLAHGIQVLLKEGDLRHRMRLHCRKVAEEEYSLERQARRYVALYEEAVKHHGQWNGI